MIVPGSAIFKIGNPERQNKARQKARIIVKGRKRKEGDGWIERERRAREWKKKGDSEGLREQKKKRGGVGANRVGEYIANIDSVQDEVMTWAPFSGYTAKILQPRSPNLANRPFNQGTRLLFKAIDAIIINLMSFRLSPPTNNRIS